MLGTEATLPDIILCSLGGMTGDLPDAGSSSVSPDSLGRAEVGPLDPYRVRTSCHGCEKPLRFIIVSTEGTLRVFEHLLLEDLNFLCPTCVAVHLNLNNGRRRR
nr:E7 protein [Rodent papillomavirus]